MIERSYYPTTRSMKQGIRQQTYFMCENSQEENENGQAKKRGGHIRWWSLWESGMESRARGDSQRRESNDGSDKRSP